MEIILKNFLKLFKFVILLGNLFVKPNIEWKNEKYNIS